jgi:hypothetical protein
MSWHSDGVGSGELSIDEITMQKALWFSIDDISLRAFYRYVRSRKKIVISRFL